MKQKRCNSEKEGEVDYMDSALNRLVENIDSMGTTLSDRLDSLEEKLKKEIIKKSVRNSHGGDGKNPR